MKINGKQLKNSILQLAIQGKLVAQDANDEPAAALLKRIRLSRAKLVKAGKLKKDKNATTIYRGEDNAYHERNLNTGEVKCIDDEIPFDIPDTWEMVRLSTLVTLVDGERKDGNNTCLDAKFLRGKSCGAQMQSGRFVSKGSQIILVDGENSGEVFTVPCDGYMGSTFKQLWVSGNVHLQYVLYFIMFYKELLRKSKKGAAIPHLNKDLFYNLIIGIPPLAEQGRIVARIEELFRVLDTSIL